MAKTNHDIFDRMIGSVNWKLGNFNMLPIVFGTSMAIVDIFMMSSVKMIHQGTMPRWWGVPLSVGLYALEPLIFLKAMNYDGMVVTNLVWNLMSNIIVTVQGILVFGESIKGLRWLGICMSLVSLCLLAYSD
jgi:multidrug transporter EmrE-like cation transporter|uniref:EamA domain-containing protein n=1 Tax=viral metagenome TaxID=1070528 RepID=A0A6C0B155_9ZZZZ